MIFQNYFINLNAHNMFIFDFIILTNLEYVKMIFVLHFLH